MAKCIIEEQIGRSGRKSNNYKDKQKEELIMKRFKKFLIWKMFYSNYGAFIEKLES